MGEGSGSAGGSRTFRLLYGIVKTAAILVGGSVTVVSLMALVGVLTANGWIRLGAALVVALGVPLFVADRLIPDDDPRAGRGLPTDVLAVGWLGFALAFVALPWSAGLLHAEAERYASAGHGWLASGTRLLTPAVDADRPPANARAPKKGGADAGVGDAATDAAALASADDHEEPKGSPDAGPAAPKKGSFTPAEIFEQWAPSVVSIQSGPGGGTGFIVGSDGTVATNHHVIANATTVQVKLMDGTWADEVWLLAEDEQADLALLRIKTEASLQPVILGDSDDVTVGERAISIGNPLGLEHTLTDGIVSARRVLQGRRMIQMSTPISPGNSGGPLFNLQGKVIGITTGVLGFGIGQNLNLAVPSNVLADMIKPSYSSPKRVGGGGGAFVGRW